MDRLSTQPPAPTRDVRLLLPQEARLRIVASHHELCCGHLGTDYTTRSIQSWCWWPGLVSQVTNYVSSCQRCRMKRFPVRPATHTNAFIKTAGFVGELNSIDLIGPFPSGLNGETYCLTSIDMFSKHLFAVPVRGKTAAVVAQAFLDNVIGQGAAVMHIHLDNGKEFKNNLFSKMAKSLHIKHTQSLVYHPQGNLAIESAHHRIKLILRASLGREPTSLWTVAVRGATRTLNSLQHPATGLTPNFIFYGRESSLPLSSMVRPPRSPSDPMTPQDRVIQLAQQSVLYLIQNRCGMEVLQRRRVHFGNKRHPLYPIPSNIGQSCMLCDTSELRSYPSKALAPRWSGPWILVGSVNNVIATVRSDFKHQLGLPETVKLAGIDRLLPAPRGLRWENVNTLSTFSREARCGVLEQGWSSLDLFAEVIEGADPIPRLHQLGVNPADID